jgi:hypothetical protein
MKCDNMQGQHHRGSSPPFQDPEHDFYDWLNGLRSIGQRDEKAPANQSARQLGNETIAFTDLKDDSSRQRDGEKGGEAL